MFAFVIVVLNIKIYYDFKSFFINYEINKIHRNIDLILKTDLKFKVFFNEWTKDLDYSSLINEVSQKLDENVLMFAFYSNKGEMLYSSMPFKPEFMSEGLKKAMNGNNYYEIVNIKENEFNEMFKTKFNYKYVQEIYLPIKSNGSIYGIIEIYKPFDNFLNDINKVRFKATVLTLIGFILFSFTLYFIVYKIELKENILMEKVKSMEKLSMLGQFASKMAHEIGTPLNVIKGTLELMAETCICTNSPSKIGVIDRQVNKINLIIRNYLYATRKPEPHYRVVELKEMIEQIVKELELIYDENITFHVSVGTLRISVDPIFLEQIIINIVKNAVDAIGGKKGNIYIESEKDTDNIYIKITDDGPGIPPEVQGKIFDPFFSTKKSGKGTGLGLAVCKELLESMGGSLSFTSQPGKTVFTLRIPYVKDINS